MKRSMALFTVSLGFSTMLHAQATPAATVSGPRYNPGPALPVIDGSFQYALNASDVIQTGLGGNSGVTNTVNLSGDVEYISPSQVYPFSLLYVGGELFSTYSGQGNGTYQTVTVSQGVVGHGWAAGVSDSLSYLPQSPTTGLSGIPGTGDLGLQPAPDPNAPAQSVVSYYARRVSNTLSGNVERELNARTSISGGASYGILRFIGNDGLDSTQIGGQVGLNRQLSRRSTGSINATYSDYSYDSNPTSFNTRGINLEYTRQLTKELTMSASAGPQLVSGFEAIPGVYNYAITSQPDYAIASQPYYAMTFHPFATSETVIPVPSRVTLAANIYLNYTRKLTSASIGYTRGVNSGSGVQLGAIGDSVFAGVQHSYGKQWTAAATVNYSHTTGLVTNSTISTVYGGLQVSRRLTTSLSAFASYTGIHQSIDNTTATQNAFSGFTQAFAIGISFAPRAKRLGQF